MAVIFAELMLRAKTSVQLDALSQVVVWQPQEVGWSLDMSIEAETTESGIPQEEFLSSFRKQTAPFVEARKNEPVLVLVPVNSLVPAHWSLLVLVRKRKTAFPLGETEEEAALAEKARWSIRYYDSRQTISIDMYSRVHQAVKLVSLGFKLNKAMEWVSADQKAESFFQQYGDCYGSLAGKPGTVKLANQPKQTDGWSCGFWVLLYAEKELRQWLGEEPRSTRKPSKDFQDEIAKYNKVIQHMQSYLIRMKKKRDHEEAKKVLKKCHDDMVKAKAAGAGITTLPASEEASAALPKPEPVITGGQTAGCGRCENSKVGCLSCVGWKAARYFRKKDDEKLAAEASQAADPQAAPKEGGVPPATAAGKTAEASQAADPKAEPKKAGGPKKNAKAHGATAVASKAPNPDSEDVN